MTRGAFLALLFVLLGGGSIYWVWRTTEHGRRYDRVRHLVKSHRSDLPESWTPEEDEKVLWENLQWFSTHAPARLTEHLVQSLSAPDPMERETGIILLANLDYVGKVTFRTPVHSWMLPNSGRLQSLKPTGWMLLEELHGNREAVSHLAKEESRTTRECFLSVALSSPPEDFEVAIGHMALRDPDLKLRMNAIYGLEGFGPGPTAAKTLHDLLKDEMPRIRLCAAASLAAWKDPEGIREFTRLSEADSPDLGPKDWWLALFALRSRLRPELPAYEVDPLKAARNWSDWLQTQPFARPLPASPEKSP